MATGTLTGQTIANTYKALLKITGTTAGGETLHATTQKVIEDGDGNPFPLSAAQDALMITSTNRLEFGTNANYVYQVGSNVLGLVAGSEIDLTATAIDINGTVDMASTLAVANTLTVGAVADEADAIITNGADGGRYDVLTVQENGNARWNLSFEGSGSTNSLTLNSNSTSNVMHWDNATGNVGIGLTAPTKLLHVQSADGSVGDNTSVAKFVNLESTSGRSKGVDIQAGTANGDYMLSMDDQAGNTKFRFCGDGNFGIGATAPSMKLQLQESTHGANIGIRLYGENDSGTGQDAHIILDPDTVFFGFSKDGSSVDLGVNSSGNVGIGTAAPEHLLHVVGSPGDNGRLAFLSYGGDGRDDDDTILFLKFTGDADATSAHFIQFGDSDTTHMGAIIANSGTAASASYSDYRSKENISLMTSGLAEINNLKPSIFNFKNHAKTHNGFIAHEVQEFIPGAVFGDKDAVDSNGDIKPQLLAMETLIPFMVKAIQELSAKVEALENA